MTVLTESPRSRSPLTIDLSSIPSQQFPQATNTLLITNLLADEIFLPANLDTIRDYLNDFSPLYSFSPLKSFRRIVVVFYNIDAAISMREALNGEKILGSTAKVFFGTQTNVDKTDQHLQAPDSGKLFFISPPPSPPHGWVSREEEPPNKDVIPEDLASALARLSAAQLKITCEPMEIDQKNEATPEASPITRARSGSATTILFDPELHAASSPTSMKMPAISVEDLTAVPDDEDDVQMDREFTEQRTILAHTSRPPVELM